jgi:hypothetical protein
MTEMADDPPAPREDDTQAIVLWTESALAARAPSPALVAWSGERAATRTIEFLTAGIHNAHTRRAYHRAARRFLAWCNARGMTLADVKSPDVAGYIQELGETLAPLSVRRTCGGKMLRLKRRAEWAQTVSG